VSDQISQAKIVKAILFGTPRLVARLLLWNRGVRVPSETQLERATSSVEQVANIGQDGRNGQGQATEN
jgi:hypothetical protein